MEQFLEKWRAFRTKAQPYWNRTVAVAQSGCRQASVVAYWCHRLRKVIYAIPLILLAIYLARMNQKFLPDMVGVALQNSGEYAMMIPKVLAVWGPLGVSAGCLLMMFLSRRTLYPWLVTLFTMAIPLLLLLTNIFPA